VSETNSIDYSKDGWANDNTLGHGLVSCDTLGQLILNPRVDSAMIWGTRWLDDRDADKSLWYAFGPRNEIRPAGMPLYIWGNFALNDMVSCDSSDKRLICYASTGAGGKKLNLVVINKSAEAIPGVIEIHGLPEVTYHLDEVYNWSGTGSEDIAPKWQKITVDPADNNSLSGQKFTGVSATVICLSTR
jgi:hypothetical protein